MTRFNNNSTRSNGSKVGSLHFDGVGPRRHEGKTVGTVATRCSCLRDVGADVGNGHRRTWHDRAGRIGDRACDDALHGL